MQHGFYIDQTRCSACCTCVVACKDWHDVPAGLASMVSVKTLEKGKYPDVFVAHLFGSCYHCANPACVEACPRDAITKREEDGIVVADREACMGKDNCGMCLEACPYGALQFGAEENAKVQKCDFCIDRWAEGKKPICVMGCPMRALDAGPLEKLRAEYGDNREAEGFIYREDLNPSVTFKPKKDIRGLFFQKSQIHPITRIAN